MQTLYSFFERFVKSSLSEDDINDIILETEENAELQEKLGGKGKNRRSSTEGNQSFSKAHKNAKNSQNRTSSANGLPNNGNVVASSSSAKGVPVSAREDVSGSETLSKKASKGRKKQSNASTAGGDSAAKVGGMSSDREKQQSLEETEKAKAFVLQQEKPSPPHTIKLVKASNSVGAGDVDTVKRGGGGSVRRGGSGGGPNCATGAASATTRGNSCVLVQVDAASSSSASEAKNVAPLENRASPPSSKAKSEKQDGRASKLGGEEMALALEGKSKASKAGASAAKKVLPANGAVSSTERGGRESDETAHGGVDSVSASVGGKKEEKLFFFADDSIAAIYQKPTVKWLGEEIDRLKNTRVFVCWQQQEEEGFEKQAKKQLQQEGKKAAPVVGDVSSSSNTSPSSALSKLRVELWTCPASYEEHETILMGFLSKLAQVQGRELEEERSDTISVVQAGAGGKLGVSASSFAASETNALPNGVSHTPEKRLQGGQYHPSAEGGSSGGFKTAFFENTTLNATPNLNTQTAGQNSPPEANLLESSKTTSGGALGVQNKSPIASLRTRNRLIEEMIADVGRLVARNNQRKKKGKLQAQEGSSSSTNAMMFSHLGLLPIEGDISALTEALGEHLKSLSKKLSLKASAEGGEGANSQKIAAAGRAADFEKISSSGGGNRADPQEPSAGSTYTEDESFYKELFQDVVGISRNIESLAERENAELMRKFLEELLAALKEMKSNTSIEIQQVHSDKEKQDNSKLIARLIAMRTKLGLDTTVKEGGSGAAGALFSAHPTINEDSVLIQTISVSRGLVSRLYCDKNNLLWKIQLRYGVFIQVLTGGRSDGAGGASSGGAFYYPSSTPVGGFQASNRPLQVVVCGLKEDAKECLAYLEACGKDTEPLKIDVDPSQVKLIIGTRGSNIKALQEDYNIVAQVEDNFALIFGPPECMVKAQSYLQQFNDPVEQLRRKKIPYDFTILRYIKGHHSAAVAEIESSTDTTILMFLTPNSEVFLKAKSLEALEAAETRLMKLLNSYSAISFSVSKKNEIMRSLITDSEYNAVRSASPCNHQFFNNQLFIVGPLEDVHAEKEKVSSIISRIVKEEENKILLTTLQLSLLKQKLPDIEAATGASTKALPGKGANTQLLVTAEKPEDSESAKCMINDFLNESAQLEKISIPSTEFTEAVWLIRSFFFQDLRKRHGIHARMEHQNSSEILIVGTPEELETAKDLIERSFGDGQIVLKTLNLKKPHLMALIAENRKALNDIVDASRVLSANVNTRGGFLKLQGCGEAVQVAVQLIEEMGENIAVSGGEGSGMGGEEGGLGVSGQGLSGGLGGGVNSEEEGGGLGSRQLNGGSSRVSRNSFGSNPDGGSSSSSKPFSGVGGGGRPHQGVATRGGGKVRGGQKVDLDNEEAFPSLNSTLQGGVSGGGAMSASPLSGRAGEATTTTWPLGKRSSNPDLGGGEKNGLSGDEEGGVVGDEEEGGSENWAVEEVGYENEPYKAEEDETEEQEIQLNTEKLQAVGAVTH